MKWFYAYLALIPVATAALIGWQRGYTGLTLVEFLLTQLGAFGVLIIATAGIGIGLVLGMTFIAYACKGACDGVDNMRGDF